MKTNGDFIKSALELIKRGGTYQKADCKTFVEKSLRNIGIKCNYPGSNAMIRQMVINVKDIDANIKAGDLVFWVRDNGGEPERYKQGGEAYDERFAGWNASHIGIYIGNGYIAESASSIGYWTVTELRKRKPNYYAEHPQIEYTSNGDEYLQDIKAILNGASAETNTHMENKQTQSKEYGIVNTAKGKLNIRKSPKDTATIKTRLYRWQIIQVQEVTDGWYKVYSVDNDYLGYAKSEFISKLNVGDVERLVQSTK